jgi:hypothetical protein
MEKTPTYEDDLLSSWEMVVNVAQFVPDKNSILLSNPTKPDCGLINQASFHSVFDGSVKTLER